ncbi:BTB/POZ domain-containing protein KCTD6 isoform X1 [Hyla sarda]|uniref:BTB/POZ domain-containing protein KCTD6 isoform X1 n=2 Tax=Hyla sarda TaxID=327740 RepID=UPI0024C34720|nr:BTB/POZ domain-containing protein KCTD6 isoform X1 [Hyla sarda]
MTSRGRRKSTGSGEDQFYHSHGAVGGVGGAGLGFDAVHTGAIGLLRFFPRWISVHPGRQRSGAGRSDWCMHSSAFRRRVHSKHQSFDQMDNGDWGYMTTDPVTLNVGGHVYTTSLSTLTRYPDSMLGAMFRGDFPTARDSQGNYFIDRDGSLFRYVLNFLRTSELTVPVDFKEFDLLRKEADFYQIEPLIQFLNDPKPLYPTDTFEEVVELSSTRKLSKYSNPVAVIITQLTITTKVHALLEGIANHFTKWNKHMMDTRDCQVSFTFGPCDYHQEVSLRVHLMEYITKQGFTIRNTRVHHMSERANENTVEHNWTFCRLARKTDD